jgi:hypothetical protein
MTYPKRPDAGPDGYIGRHRDGALVPRSQMRDCDFRLAAYVGKHRTTTPNYDPRPLAEAIQVDLAAHPEWIPTPAAPAVPFGFLQTA